MPSTSNSKAGICVQGQKVLRLGKHRKFPGQRKAVKMSDPELLHHSFESRDRRSNRQNRIKQSVPILESKICMHL